MCLSVSTGDDAKISHGRNQGININGMNGCHIYYIKNATYCKCSDFPTLLCPGTEKFHFENEMYTQVHTNDCFSGQEGATKTLESLASTVLTSIGMAALCAILVVLLVLQRNHYTRGQPKIVNKSTKSVAV